jgi:hypothetical protein
MKKYINEIILTGASVVNVVALLVLAVGEHHLLFAALAGAVIATTPFIWMKK